jgi:hypothetical protein
MFVLRYFASRSASLHPLQRSYIDSTSGIVKLVNISHLTVASTQKAPLYRDYITSNVILEMNI